MSTQGTPIFKGLDMIAFSSALSLVIIGWAMIYAVGYGSGYPDSIPEFLKTQAGKQAIFLGVSIILFVSVLIIDWKFWRTFANPIYFGVILLLVGVLIFGNEVKGAKSWFHLFGFSLQPSELAKFATCVALSDYLASVKVTSASRRSLILAVGIIGLPAALILLQPDAGSALVFGSFALVLFRNGLSPNVFIVGIYLFIMLILGITQPIVVSIMGLFLLGNGILSFSMKNQTLWLSFFVLLSIASLIIFNQDLQTVALIGMAAFFVISLIIYLREKTFDLPITLSSILVIGLLVAFSSKYAFNNILQPHQQDRINVWLQPSKSDPHGSAYNLAQSKVAIGSGGFLGKGFLNGSLTKLNFVPEQSTDFIFSSIGEEHGFIGSTIVICLFLTLLWRIIIIAEKQRSVFSRNYAYSVAGIIFLHVIVNIGMTMGLFPVIGIPLPFISYGGSSLVGFTLMIAVLLKLDQNLKSV